MKFKIGDKVRVTKPSGGEGYKGRIRKILRIEDGQALIEGEELYHWFSLYELSPVKPKAKKEKRLKQEDARTRKVLKNAFREVEEETKKEGKIERLRYLDKEVISPIIDILEKYDLKTNRGNLLALGRILIFILKKQRELNSLLDAFNSTKEEVK